MNKVTLTWKVTGAVKTPRLLSSSVTFQIIPNPGLYTAMGVDPKYGCVSQVLVPTATYHQVIRNLLKKKLAIDVPQKKLPFTVPVQALGQPLTFDIKARYYPPHLIVLTIQLSPFELPLTDLVDWLAPKDFEKNFTPISDVAKWTLGLAQASDHRAFEPAQSLLCRPIVHVHDVCPESEFQTHFVDHKADYVGILIRSEASHLAPELVERVLKKNEEHNQKSLTQKLLLDKLGILHLTSGASDWTLVRSDELFEIASVFQELLKQYFTIARTNPDYADFILFAIRTWIEKPEVVFAKSVTHRLIWKLLCNEFNLEPHLEDVLGGVDKEALAIRYQYQRQCDLKWWGIDSFPEVLGHEIQKLSSTDKTQRNGEMKESERPSRSVDRSREVKPAPKVVSTDPANGAINVPRDLTTIRIRFDRPMDSVGHSLTQTGGFGLGDPEVDYDADSHTFSFTRDNPGLLPANTPLTFTVNPDEPPGAGFVDLEGNRAAMHRFSFTTGAEPKPSDRRGSQRRAHAEGDAGEPASADLQLLVTLASDGKTLSYILNSPGGDYNFLQLGSVTLQASPRELMQRTSDRLSTLALSSPETRTPAQTQQAIRELADIGSNLYDELLPDAFKEEYCILREKHLGCNLWLTSNEPWIPWEIVRPIAYDRRGALLYDDEPLCEAYRLARWVSGTAAPARLALQRALVVRPPADLKATGIETGYFAGLPGIVPGLTVADPVETVDATLAAFSAGQTQLYHFACHGNFDLTDPNDSRLKLADDFLTPNQLTGGRKSGLLRARPLVFVNACHAGERGFGLTRLGGWAERFIAAGASAFVGSLWEINDDLAARFAVEFYNRLFGVAGHARQPLGQAFREARLALKALDPGNPTRLAYVLYGNPRAEWGA